MLIGRTFEDKINPGYCFDKEDFRLANKYLYNKPTITSLEKKIIQIHWVK